MAKAKKRTKKAVRDPFREQPRSHQIIGLWLAEVYRYNFCERSRLGDDFAPDVPHHSTLVPAEGLAVAQWVAAQACEMAGRIGHDDGEVPPAIGWAIASSVTAAVARGGGAEWADAFQLGCLEVAEAIFEADEAAASDG